MVFSIVAVADLGVYEARVLKRADKGKEDGRDDVGVSRNGGDARWGRDGRGLTGLL